MPLTLDPVTATYSDGITLLTDTYIEYELVTTTELHDDEAHQDGSTVCLLAWCRERAASLARFEQQAESAWLHAAESGIGDDDDPYYRRI